MGSPSLYMAARSPLTGVTDLNRYPIDDPTTEQFTSLVSQCREKYLETGIVTLPGFLTQEAVIDTVRSVVDTKGQEWFTDTHHNVFLDDGDPQLPKDHVRNRELHTTVASLAYDRLDSEGPLLRLYHNDSFTTFLSQVLGLPSLHRLGDPLGAASINIFPPGTSHSWHFDESAFSVTLMLQKPETGGIFRHTAPIREPGSEDEALYKHICGVLDGTDDIATDLTFEPGTLSIFRGSSCLHEVTVAGGGRDRLVAVFCFSTKPGIKNSAKVQEMFWGRVVG